MDFPAGRCYNKEKSMIGEMGMGLNEGLIYTNGNCIGCNRCISGCPVLGANVSVKKGSASRMLVDGDACIQCGKCLKICQHNARAYRDDTERFLDGLRAGEQISVLVEPSFFAVCGEQAEVLLRQLKELGVRHFYDVGYGAEITAWAYLEYLEKNPSAGAIVSSCPANMNYIRKYSKPLTEKIIPVYSPVLCLAVYLRKYRGVTGQLAFLSPCIAKKHEFEDEACAGLVQYNVTFEHLEEALKSEEARRASEEELDVEIELRGGGPGYVYSLPGGLSGNLRPFLPEQESIREISSVGYVYDYFRRLEQQLEEQRPLPQLVDCMNCSFGCLNGTGLQSRQRERQEESFLRVQACGSPEPEAGEEENPYLPQLTAEERRGRLRRLFAGLRPEDFMRPYSRDGERVSDRLCEMREADEARVQTIFLEMYKDTEEQRSIDCYSCGYRTCREMAVAIARGYNHKENCVYYLKDHGLRMAMKDPRYGIYNSNAFGQFLTGIIAKKKQEDYVCLQFNLLNFNRINQRYGYQQGDVILKLYCNLVSALARQDEMIALIGGNSFAAALHRERLKWAIEQLVGGVRVPFLSWEDIRIAARVAVYWPQRQDTSSLMILDRLAQIYGLLLKNSQEKVMYYDREMRRKLEEEAEIYSLIEPAMQQKEFEVYYQPKVDMRTRQLCGAEALIRWNHAGTVISPGTFIPVCEKHGLIDKLDFFVLESVCESVSAWAGRGLRLVPVSVNFSRQHFVSRDVAEEINGVAERFRTPRQYLEVEFTETAYLDDSDSLIYCIDRLHEYGIASSMDDFGTGYSSLSMLQNMSFDTLKLDKSFLDAERYTQKRGRTVIENIIRMAKQLDMTVVSEGIETEEELAFMCSMGCDLAQGYLFDRPLRHEEFERRMVQEYYP